MDLAFSGFMVLLTIGMGFWARAPIKKPPEIFFVAGRSVSVGWNASAISGEYLSAASFMGVAGMVMSSGYDALWYPVCYACGYLFLLLFIAGPLRRFGAYTIPDFAEGRYDSPLFRKNRGRLCALHRIFLHHAADERSGNNPGLHLSGTELFRRVIVVER